MCKLAFLQRFLSPTAHTAPTFGRNSVGTLFTQSRNTCRNTLLYAVSRLSRLKNTINGATGSGCRNTFPNYYQESYSMDEYDYSDYEGWLDEFEDCEEWDCDEWWDAVEDDNTESWHVRAVNEAIAEENGDTPPPPDSMGDIPF